MTVTDTRTPGRPAPGGSAARVVAPLDSHAEFRPGRSRDPVGLLVGKAQSRVPLCGDAHLSNFGAFASPERRLVFDVNNFDETLPGPFEWDVKRLAASFAVAGAHARSGDRIALAAYLGGSSKFDEAIADFAETYADQNERDYAALRNAVKDGKVESTTEI